MRKNTLLLIACTLFFGLGFSQSNEEIASVYIKKARINFDSLQIDEAKVNYEKAIKLLDTIQKESVERLGTLIHFKLGNLNEAKHHAKLYFNLAADHQSDEYLNQLDIFVTIEEKLDSIKKVEEAKELARLARLKELKRIDSLKTVWTQNSNAMSLSIDEINPFDSNGLATYKKGEFYGIIDHTGKIILKANNYKAVRAYDGYILLLDNSIEPTSILCFISNTKESFLIPEVSTFNELATTYGKVMIPRGNHLLVAYPNNSLQTMVYNLKTRTYETVIDTKTLFKELKKADKIDSSNYKEGKVKINKVWYNFGGDIGSKVYSLYTSTYDLYGYLFHYDGAVVTVDEFDFLGSSYKNRIPAIKSNKQIWLDQNRNITTAPENEAGNYVGTTKVVKLANGNLQLQKTENGKTTIFLKEDSMDLMNAFLKQNNVAEGDIK